MSPRRAETISPLLVVIAEALDTQQKERPREGDALRALGALARVEVFARGVFAPSEDMLYQAIERVATTHLGLGEARKALGDALTSVEPIRKQDEIQDAINHLCDVLDRVYFNAGLAFGLTVAQGGTLCPLRRR
jgi:hypothetical protein